MNSFPLLPFFARLFPLPLAMVMCCSIGRKAAAGQDQGRERLSSDRTDDPSGYKSSKYDCGNSGATHSWGILRGKSRSCSRRCEGQLSVVDCKGKRRMERRRQVEEANYGVVRGRKKGKCGNSMVGKSGFTSSGTASTYKLACPAKSLLRVLICYILMILLFCLLACLLPCLACRVYIIITIIIINFA